MDAAAKKRFLIVRSYLDGRIVCLTSTEAEAPQFRVHKPWVLDQIRVAVDAPFALFDGSTCGSESVGPNHRGLASRSATPRLRTGEGRGPAPERTRSLRRALTLEVEKPSVTFRDREKRALRVNLWAHEWD
jgi:hypothetical protein